MFSEECHGDGIGKQASSSRPLAGPPTSEVVCIPSDHQEGKNG